MAVAPSGEYQSSLYLSLCHHMGQNMTILDVPRNRHLESIRQEIRARHDFLQHFCVLPFLCIWFTFPGHKKCVYVQN